MPAPSDIMKGLLPDDQQGSSGSSASQVNALTGTDTTDTDQPKTLEDVFGEQYNWQHVVVDKIMDDIKAVAKRYELDLDYVGGWFQGVQIQMLKDLSDRYMQGFQGRPGVDVTTPHGIAQMIEYARNWVSAYFPGFRDAIMSLGQGGGGGGGARGPSAADIRAQFDLDAMTEAANNMWKSYLLEDSAQARAIAKSYVDLIVSNPNQKVDYEQFVLDRIRNTSRYKTIYARKPEAQTEAQFLQPLVQQVYQTIGSGYGDQAADIAIDAARLNASPQQLAERLDRTPQVTSSAPFIQAMGEKLARVKGVLR